MQRLGGGGASRVVVMVAADSAFTSRAWAGGGVGVTAAAEGLAALGEASATQPQRSRGVHIRGECQEGGWLLLDKPLSAWQSQRQCRGASYRAAKNLQERCGNVHPWGVPWAPASNFYLAYSTIVPAPLTLLALQSLGGAAGGAQAASLFLQQPALPTLQHLTRLVLTTTYQQNIHPWDMDWSGAQIIHPPDDAMDTIGQLTNLCSLNISPDKWKFSLQQLQQLSGCCKLTELVLAQLAMGFAEPGRIDENGVQVGVLVVGGWVGGKMGCVWWWWGGLLAASLLSWCWHSWPWALLNQAG